MAEPTKPTRSKGLRPLVGDGFVYVAGTLDIPTAVAFLSTWRDPEQVWCDDHDREDCPCPSFPRHAEEASPGWIRTVPGCPGWCGEGHSYHYTDAAAGSRGAFPAVAWYW